MARCLQEPKGLGQSLEVCSRVSERETGCRGRLASRMHNLQSPSAPLPALPADAQAGGLGPPLTHSAPLGPSRSPVPIYSRYQTKTPWEPQLPASWRKSIICPPSSRRLHLTVLWKGLSPEVSLAPLLLLGIRSKVPRRSVLSAPHRFFFSLCSLQIGICNGLS